MSAMSTETLVPTVKYRSLEGEDTAALMPAIEKLGWVIPYPHIAVPVVAEVDGQIVGFGIAQLIPHCEPLHILPEWRGMGIAEELSKRVIEKITESGAKKFCCVAQNAFAEKLCEANGMKAVEGRMYVKE